MDNDNKGFEEIHRILKKGGKTHISVQGAGGLALKTMYDVIIPEYKKNPNVKKLLNDIMNGKVTIHKKFFMSNLNSANLTCYVWTW